MQAVRHKAKYGLRSCSSVGIRNHGISGVGTDLQKSSSPTPLSGVWQATEGHIQAGFESLWRKGLQKETTTKMSANYIGKMSSHKTPELHKPPMMSSHKTPVLIKPPKRSSHLS